MKNEKTTWVFLYIKYSKFWSVSLEHFVERKHPISEEWRSTVIPADRLLLLRSETRPVRKPNNWIFKYVPDCDMVKTGQSEWFVDDSWPPLLWWKKPQEHNLLRLERSSDFRIQFNQLSLFLLDRVEFGWPLEEEEAVDEFVLFEVSGFNKTSAMIVFISVSEKASGKGQEGSCSF